MCHDDDPCYSVSQYLRAVQDIQATLEEPIENILVLTDEHDPAYIEQARALGWKFAEDGKNGPGGEEVKEKFGGWSVRSTPRPPFDDRAGKKRS